MKEQDAIFKKRLEDFSRTAYYRDIAIYTDFLDLNELHMVHSFQPKEGRITIRFFGGYDEAERQIAAFLPDALSYEEEQVIFSDFPIACLKISPASKKFCEKLSHRDYLGALIHLGIERCKLGDIVLKDQEAYLFCHRQMADFLLHNLDKIRHTAVKITEVTDVHDFPRPQRKEIQGTVASVRLDAMIALAFSSSRSSMLGLIEGGKVFVNGKMVVSNGHPLKEGDIISVRGYGKFQYEGMKYTTKKGRCSVTVSRYI